MSLAYDLPPTVRFLDLERVPSKMQVAVRVAIDGIDKTVVLFDDELGFPTEALITKLRLLA